MDAGGSELLGDAQVIVQGVGGLGGVEQVAGVANRAFDVSAALADSVDDRASALRVVECVEHPEHVHPRRPGVRGERLDHFVRIRGVAEGVASADQHLRQHVRCRGAQEFESLPWVLPQESQCRIEGCPTPAFKTEEPGQ